MRKANEGTNVSKTRMTMTSRVILPVLLGLSFSSVQAGEPIVIGEAKRIHSVVLKEDRDYRVSLPKSYKWAKDRRYPVLYVLDGQAHFAHTAGSVDYLAAQGDIPEMIVVAIESTIRVRDFTQTDWPSRWIGGGGADKFKQCLATELIPEVEKTYRADGFRVLCGHSAGGQFTLYCLTSSPSLFQAYFALSPSLEWDNYLPQRSLEKSLKASHELNRFLYVARSDDSGQALAEYDRLVETLKTFAPKGFRWHSQPFPDESHGSIPLIGQIDALRHLYAGYRLHEDMMDRGLLFAQKHFEGVSKTLGWPVAVPENVINSLGHEALAKQKTEDAIALFKRNVENNPNSANAFDSLADGYEKAGMRIDAARASDRAVELATEFQLPERSAYIEHAKKIRERLKQAPLK
jgi:predicted alpha/beta superfamily hydrolase